MKYDALKKDAETAAQDERTLIVVKVPTLLALIEERDELLKALYKADEALVNACPQMQHYVSAQKRHSDAEKAVSRAIVKAEAE